MKKQNTWILLWTLLLLAAQACQTGNGDNEAGNWMLARVHNKILYLSDLEGMIPAETSSEDSAQIINAFVERWVREAALMHEAERNVPKDLNIDKLVRDYRASLIRHTYEKILIEQLLDSTVTQAQLGEYYQLNKDQFPLSTDIARCRFVKLPANSPELDQFEKWWKSDKLEDFQQLLSYSNDHAIASVLDDSLWISMPELGELWPGDINELRNLQPGQKRTARNDTFQYYFQLNEIMRENEIAPVGHVADQLRKVILHQRKMKLLDETRENMYQDALRRNMVKVF